MKIFIIQFINLKLKIKKKQILKLIIYENLSNQKILIQNFYKLNCFPTFLNIILKKKYFQGNLNFK